MREELDYDIHEIGEDHSMFFKGLNEEQELIHDAS